MLTFDKISYIVIVLLDPIGYSRSFNFIIKANIYPQGSREYRI